MYFCHMKAENVKVCYLVLVIHLSVSVKVCSNAELRNPHTCIGLPISFQYSHESFQAQTKQEAQGP